MLRKQANVVDSWPTSKHLSASYMQFQNIYIIGKSFVLKL